MEVLVAILITTIFVATAMQAVVLSAVLRARARQISQVTDWIQEDMETVRGVAAQVPYTETELSQQADANQNVITVKSKINEFRVGDSVLIGSDSTSNNVQSVDTANNRITLAQNLATTQPANTKIIARCRPNEGDINGGFADYFRQDLPALARGGSIEIAGKNYTLERLGSGSTNPTIRNNRPYELLEITYKATAEGEEDPVAEISTEIVPNAFFQCP